MRMITTLSPRRVDVLLCLASDVPTKNIARKLKITERTVMSHIAALKELYDCRTRCGIVAGAFRDEVLVWDDNKQAWRAIVAEVE